MRQKEPSSNYLANTESSEFDNLFRRISGLANSWLDHNACILKNRQISVLVDHIIENRYFRAAPFQTSKLLSTQEYLLGQFIQTVFTLQDENTTVETKRVLRENIEKILDAFDQIKLDNPIKPNIDFNKLNKSYLKRDQGVGKRSFWQKISGLFK